MPLISSNQFANRCLHLCAGIGILAVCIAWRLVDLQIVDKNMIALRAEQDMVEFEVIPAQRGIIMDRHEEILTNNIQHAELIADRIRLREPTMVCWGLAYNIASHDEKWPTLDADGRASLIKRTHRQLLKRAEKKGDRDALVLPHEVKGKGLEGAREMLKNLYDEDVCNEYFRAHDRLVAEWLAPYLQMEPAEIVDKIAQEGREHINQEIVLAKNLTEDRAEEIKKALAQARIRGLSCQSTMTRSYVAPTSLAHVLGFVDYKNQGVCGIESYLNGYLKGQNGSREYRRDARGLILPSEDDRFKEPIHGQNIRLTIDMRLQNIVEQELEAGIIKNRAARGTIIVVEPKTGDILALASYPSFNLNTKENQGHAALNYAVQGSYEPGSTFKVVAVTSAVDTGKLGFGTAINCEPFMLPGRSKPISDKPRHYSALTVADVLKKSSNTGAARIGFTAEWPTYKQYLDRFGLTKRTGVTLPSEGRCLLQDGKSKGNFAVICFGYSVTVTPLHMAMVYAAIANDGQRMKPRLIDKIISADGTVVDECEPQPVARVMKERTAKDLRKALYNVTLEGGTARRAAIPGYHVGGKTGTAHKVKETGGYYDNRYTVSFVGMVPVEDPAFVCLVVIDDPHPTDCHAGGGTVCAPIWRAAAKRMLNTLNIPPCDPAAAEKARLAEEAERKSAPPVALRSASPARQAAKPASGPAVRTPSRTSSRSAAPRRSGARRATHSTRTPSRAPRA